MESSPQPTTQLPESVVPQKGKSKKLFIIIALLLLVLCCCLSFLGLGLFGYLQSGDQCIWKGPLSSVDQGACAQNNTILPNNQADEKNNDTVSPPSNNNEDTGNDNYETGELFNLGATFAVSVDRVRKNGNDYEIEMSITNTSNTTQPFSTLLFLNLKSELTDSYTQNFFSARYQEEGAQLDGEIAAGKTKRGVVVYNVDDNPQSLTFKVSEGLFSDEYVEFNIL